MGHLLDVHFAKLLQNTPISFSLLLIPLIDSFITVLLQLYYYALIKLKISNDQSIDRWRCAVASAELAQHPYTQQQF